MGGNHSLQVALERVTSLLVVGISRGSEPFPSLDFSNSPLRDFTSMKCDGFYHTWSTVVGLGRLRIERSQFNATLLSPDLVELFIKKPVSSTRPSLDAFCDVLCSLKKLRHLSLHGVFSWCIRATKERSNTKVVMPSLVSLILSNESEEDCAYFLSRLSSPGLMHLTIALNNAATSLSQLVGILPELMSNSSLHVASSSPALYISNSSATSRAEIRVLEKSPPTGKISKSNSLGWPHQARSNPHPRVWAHQLLSPTAVSYYSTTMDNLDESSWVKAERARIDQEILQLEEQLRDLRLRRNALAPISQLPPEILSRIMTAYQRGIFNKQQRKVKKGEFFSPRSLSWISITQVSSHWRDVALQCPTLWNVISLPTMRREWAELLFLRSKGAPVSLTVQSPTVGGEYWLGILPSLERSLDRITSLLIFGDLQTRKHLSPLDFSRSPLKSFTAIWCSGWLYHSCSTVVGLGHVRMENSYLDMAFISQDLVTLEIKLPDTSGMPTLQVFYDTLSTLTRLSHLTLDNVFSRCSETTTDKSQITMPSLVSLTLVNDTEHRYAHFLSRLVPPQGMVHLTVSLSKPPTALTKLSAILPEFISNTSLPIASSSSVFYILGNQGTRRVTIRALDSLNEDVISVSWIRDDMLETLSIAEFVSQLPLKTPRDLKLTISAPKILQELSSPTSMLADLETLTLSNSKALADAIPSCECVRGANTMLSEAESHNDHSDPAPLRGCPMCQEFSASIFPDVRTLRFEQIKFDEQNFGLSSLIRFVAHRRDCGRPLTEVVIKCDAMSIAPEFQNRLERLRKIVDIVIYVGGALYKWDKEE